jgi:hypothetical protein
MLWKGAQPNLQSIFLLRRDIDPQHDAQLTLVDQAISAVPAFRVGGILICVTISAPSRQRGTMATLKVELAHIVIPLLLITTPIAADVNSGMARRQLEAERLCPIPPNRGGRNWTDRAANLEKRAEGIETCMRAAGCRSPQNVLLPSGPTKAA